MNKIRDGTKKKTKMVHNDGICGHRHWRNNK